jgi:transposase
MVSVGTETCTERPVQAFGTTTPELHRLRDWLLACAIRTVAMESTGNYWVAAADVLEAAGIEVWLVNARHVKGVPGRLKTDVADAEWLRRLHTAGLLTAPRRKCAPCATSCASAPTSSAAPASKCR